jgi:hypothetical protein
MSHRVASVKIEYFYTGLLIAAFAFIAWMSVSVAYKLYLGQR